MIEIERKYRIPEDKIQQIESALSLQYELQSEADQVDSVYLVGKDSFKDFHRGEPVARIRTVNGDNTLTVKRALNSQGDTEEYEVKVDSGETVKSLITALGCVLVTEVAKYRKTFSTDGVSFMLDNVKRLGMFLEIEIISDTQDSGESERIIGEYAGSLGLSDDDIETRKYDELISALD